MEPQTSRRSRKKAVEVRAHAGVGAEGPVEREEIARRAYSLFQQRGAVDGHDWEDWLIAERQLQEERSRRRSQ